MRCCVGETLGEDVLISLQMGVIIGDVESRLSLDLIILCLLKYQY